MHNPGVCLRNESVFWHLPNADREQFVIEAVIKLNLYYMIVFPHIHRSYTVCLGETKLTTYSCTQRAPRERYWLCALDRRSPTPSCVS